MLPCVALYFFIDDRQTYSYTTNVFSSLIIIGCMKSSLVDYFHEAMWHQAIGISRDCCTLIMVTQYLGQASGSVCSIVSESDLKKKNPETEKQ